MPEDSSNPFLEALQAGLSPIPVDTTTKRPLLRWAPYQETHAQLDEARLNRDRAVRLVEQGVVAKADFDAADATFKVAQSRYQDAIEEIRNRQALLAQRRSELAMARQQRFSSPARSTSGRS